MSARLGAILCAVTLSVAFKAALAEPMHHYLDLRRGTSSAIVSDGSVIMIGRTADGTTLWNGTPVTCKQMNARFRSMWSKDKHTVIKNLQCEHPDAVRQDLHPHIPQTELGH
jgi:hypothetical protein